MSRKVENAIGVYMEGIRDGNPREAVARYTADRYTQHSTGVRDGANGFVEFFEDTVQRSPVRDIQIVRIWRTAGSAVHACRSLLFRAASPQLTSLRRGGRQPARLGLAKHGQ